MYRGGAEYCTQDLGVGDWRDLPDLAVHFASKKIHRTRACVLTNATRTEHSTNSESRLFRSVFTRKNSVNPFLKGSKMLGLITYKVKESSRMTGESL